MGCCQASIVEHDLHLNQAGSMIAQDKHSYSNRKIPISLPLVSESSIPPPKLTPCFGKKFNFDDYRSSHETKHLEIN
jgi:hypothetical protein